MSLLSKTILLKRWNFSNWSKFAECELSDGSNPHIFEKVMSRNHAVLHYREQRFFLEDTNSSNGTHVNDQRLQPYQVAPTIYWFFYFPHFMGCHFLPICRFPRSHGVQCSSDLWVPIISWGPMFYWWYAVDWSFLWGCTGVWNRGGWTGNMSWKMW